MTFNVKQPAIVDTLNSISTTAFVVCGLMIVGYNAYVFFRYGFWGWWDFCISQFRLKTSKQIKYFRYSWFAVMPMPLVPA